MNFSEVSVDTLLILMRQARLRLQKYERLRLDNENTAADRLIPQMLTLRQDLGAALRGAIGAHDPDDRPSDDIQEEARFLLRTLAPGRPRPSSEILEDASLVMRRQRRRQALAATPRLPIARRLPRSSETATVRLDQSSGELVEDAVVL